MEKKKKKDGKYIKKKIRVWRNILKGRYNNIYIEHRHMVIISTEKFKETGHHKKLFSKKVYK